MRASAPGRVVGTPANMFRIEYERARVAQFLVDARTRFGGLDRYGVPYLGRGIHGRLTATPCSASGGRWKFVGWWNAASERRSDDYASPVVESIRGRKP